MTASIQIGRVSKRLMFAAVFLTVLVLSQTFLQAARLQMHKESILNQTEVVYVPAEAQSRLIYLGYDQAAADVLWIRSINYFARHFIGDREYPWLSHFIDQVITFDPKFHDAYLWAGSSLLYGRMLSNEVVREANVYYERALKVFPNDHESAYRLGMNYHAEMQSEDKTERAEFRRKGLYYLELAANMPDAPNRITELVAALNLKYGSDQLAIQYLTDLYLRTDDEKERARLEIRLSALQKESGLGSQSHLLEKFRTDWLRELPYANRIFYGLLKSKLTHKHETWHQYLDIVDLSNATQKNRDKE